MIGSVALLLALWGLQMLPVNYAGVGLILLGIAFFVAEAFVPSYGALGIGGVAAFAFGALLLIDSDAPGFGIPLTLIGDADAGLGRVRPRCRRHGREGAPAARGQRCAAHDRRVGRGDRVHRPGRLGRGRRRALEGSRRASRCAPASACGSRASTA